MRLLVGNSRSAAPVHRLSRGRRFAHRITVMTQTILVLLTATASAASMGERQYVFHLENVLGTSLELKVVAATSAAAEKAETRVLAEIDREAAILSGYDPASEFSGWMKTRGEGVRVSDDLFNVLSRFDRYRTL